MDIAAYPTSVTCSPMIHIFFILVDVESRYGVHWAIMLQRLLWKEVPLDVGTTGP